MSYHRVSGDNWQLKNKVFGMYNYIYTAQGCGLAIATGLGKERTREISGLNTRVNTNLLKLLAWAIAVFGLLSGFGIKAHAQNVEDYVSVAPPAEWVAVQEVDLNWVTEVKGRDHYYNLVDWQSRYGNRDRSYYSRYTQKLITAKGVEDNSNVAISFDPNYQTVTIHRIDIIRDGQKIDRLDLDEMQIYRVETDRKKLIYNGDLQVSLTVPDVRPGDILDYAFTRHGGNPDIGNSVRYTVTQKYNDVIHNLHYRALIHNSIPIFKKTFNSPRAADESISESYNVYEWNLDNSTPFVMDDELPDWYRGGPTVFLSSFETWSDVGKFFAPKYAVPKVLPASLTEVVSKIKKDTDDPKLRVRAATDFVQSEIRYLGIELGQGGYTPRAPEKVMTRRYGDCKDMTLLLITLLDALDISAQPLLVDMEDRGGIAKEAPSYAAFDHVVVRAKIEDEYYVIDPTRGEQLGTLETMQQGFFQNGVVIGEDSPGLVDASVTEAKFYEDHTYTFDIVSDAEAVTFDLSSKYYMYRADSMLNWYRETGHEETEKAFFEYYLDDFPTLEIAEPLEVDVSEELGLVDFKISFKLPKAWQLNDAETQTTLTVYATDTDNAVPDEDAQNRTSPYKISHPIRVRETQVFKVNDNWGLENDSFERTTDAFDFKKLDIRKGDIFTQTYTYVSKEGHIEADKFKSSMDALKEIDDELGIVLQQGTGAQTSTNGFEIFAGIYMLIGMLAGAILGIRHAKSQTKYSDRQILYPISTSKFIIMTVLTLGFYHYYWIYRNWLWLRDREGRQVMPFWRTFFFPIMNLSLFPNISEVPQHGRNWFAPIAIPLAILYIVFVIAGSVMEGIASVAILGGVITLVANLLLIPVSVAVLQKNEEYADQVAINSRYDGVTLAAILGLLPVAIYMGYLSFWG